MRCSVVVETSDWQPHHEIQLHQVLEQAALQLPEAEGHEIVLVLATAHPAAAAQLAGAFPGVRQVQAPPGLDSYALKNLGAQHARGDLLLFLDANCLPRPGWVDNAIAGMQRGGKAVAAVQGVARFSRGRLSRFWDAVWWAWSLRSEGPTDTLYTANNLAVRRSVFLANPFDAKWPYHAGLERHFGDELRSLGHQLLIVPQMAVVHNYAEGQEAFLRFSMVWGYFQWQGRQRQRTAADRIIRRAGWLAPLVLPPLIWARSAATLLRHWGRLGYSRAESWKIPGLILLFALFSGLAALGIVRALAGRPPLLRPS